MNTLRDREIEILNNMTAVPGRWHRPMDVGGRDASHHSYSLQKLARKGYVEKKIRGGRSRPAYAYRITEKGVNTIKEWRAKS